MVELGVFGGVALTRISFYALGIWLKINLYLFHGAFLEPKKSWKPAGIVLFLVAISASDFIVDCLAKQLSMRSVARMILVSVLSFAVHMIITIPYHGSMKKRLLLSLLFFIASIAAEMLSVVAFTAATRLSLEEISKDSVMHHQRQWFYGMILFVAVASIRHFMKKRVNKPISRTYLLILAIPFMSLAVFILLFTTNSPAIMTVSLFAMAVNILSFLIYSQMEQYYQQNQEYALQEQQYQNKEQHYQVLEAYQSEIRAIKHDLKNQLIAMNAYVNAGSAERAGKQIGALITRLADSSRYTFTRHPGVNGLLVETYRRAEEEGVLCDFHVSIPQELGVGDADLTALLGNILDNALEACRFCAGKRYIRLDMLSQGSTFIVKCENSTDGSSQSMQTRKKDAVRHGIGMGNIKQIVEKYDGEIQYHFMPHHFELECTLFLRTEALSPN